jgi:two-component system, cell cycle sensor histidine kinase and response regulator CckA
MSRVLLVDDEELLLRATESMLRTAGVEVEAALGGERALELLATRRFDAALIDLMMPRMSGIELVRRVRAVAPELRLVLTSSFPLSPGQIARLGVGDVRFVPKPAPVATLIDALGLAEPAEPRPAGSMISPGVKRTFSPSPDRRL